MCTPAPTNDDDLLTSPDFVARIKGINNSRETYSDPSAQIAALLPLASSDPNPQVRYMAVSQLSGVAPEDVSDADGAAVLEACLKILAEDSDSSCKAGAADVIAALRLQDGFDTLVDTFNGTSDWMLRFTIAAGVGVMANERSYEFLTAVIDSCEPTGDELLLTATIGALADLGNVDALPIVKKFSDFPDQAVQERVKIAVEVLSKKV